MGNFKGRWGFGLETDKCVSCVNGGVCGHLKKYCPVHGKKPNLRTPETNQKSVKRWEKYRSNFINRAALLS